MFVVMRRRRPLVSDQSPEWFETRVPHPCCWIPRSTFHPVTAEGNDTAGGRLACGVPQAVFPGGSFPTDLHLRR